jgi:hypothetical protein
MEYGCLSGITQDPSFLANPRLFFVWCYLCFLFGMVDDNMRMQYGCLLADNTGLTILGKVVPVPCIPVIFFLLCKLQRLNSSTEKFCAS